MLYLLHFKKPYRHCRHYLGYTADYRIKRRIYEHFHDPQVGLLKALQQQGTPWQVARIMEGDRQREAHLKYVVRNIRGYCPACQKRAMRPSELTDLCEELNVRLAGWQHQQGLITEKEYLWVAERSLYLEQYQTDHAVRYGS